MNRAIVIYGDPTIGNAIADGMRAALPSAEPLDSAQAEVVQAEIDRQKIARLLRVAVGNRKTPQDYACMAERAKYEYTDTRRRGRLYGAILAVWALLWYGIFSAAEYLQDWNREA